VNRYLLDTNILSNATKPRPSASLIAWLEDQPDDALFICSLNLAEIWSGILELPAGKHRRALESWFAGPEGPQALFAGRLLTFDEKAAFAWGRLMAEGEKIGRPRSPIDMILAGIAEANDCIVVTDNEKHFAGLTFINPMRPLR
jgi:toxin FitB